ncbi:MIP/aquaporin family protein [Leuconostoc pseudomesenteroides]|uniref:MIP/aquaporin family protein n=1 Tax=Leuconostoc pseudomesenteroides TaxID=33968 RepID=UPI0016661CDB|nr:MIP/aquaporin family protein [Leuconostoc pseudomesenteroides]
MHSFLGELIGTCSMIVFGQSVSAGINLKGTFGSYQKNNWFFVTFAWGMAVTAGTYIAESLGSLGHLNPAITISYALFGIISWGNVVPYLFGQFIGAFIGATIVIFNFYDHFAANKNFPILGIFATRPAKKNYFFNFMNELIATFFLVIVLLNLGTINGGIKPYISGICVFLVGSGLGTTTGFALNPARDFSPRLAYTIIPIPHKTKSSSEWNYSWIPLIAPTIGAILACFANFYFHL